MQHPTRVALAVASATALFAVLTVPAFAHHGWGGNAAEETELTGTVEMLSLAGPHASMKVRSGGQVWDITLAPPARAQRAGLQADSIPVGATVTVRGHRNKTAGRYEMKSERVTWNDEVFDVYPNRH
ncbi:MAG: DUF6152 family protein [Acidobacteria bacterium]|nr:DUF6152 family protein [Acidobacteriota bacterium]